MKLIVTFGKIKGYVMFEKCDKCNEVKVIFDLFGIAPNAVHAIHIHEFGDARDGCKSLGPHYNPYGETHGSILWTEFKRHAGDLINNIKTDSKGRFQFEYCDNLLTLEGIVGRSVVIHQDPDDLGLGGDKESLLTGNAGKRIDYGIIGIANPKM